MKTADEFLTNLKARVTLPENQALLDDDKLLQFAHDVTLANMVPKIISVDEKFFQTVEDVPIVANQRLYEIPARAIGATLSDLKYRITEDQVCDLDYVDNDVEDEYRGTVGVPSGFMFRQDMVYLLSKPQDATHVLEMWLDVRPSKPIKLESCAKVSSVSGDDVTVVSVPDGWTAGTVVDFIRNKGMGRVLSYEKTITNIAGSVITFAADVVPDTAPNDLKANDYIAPTGRTPIFQIPMELTVLLETWAAKRCMGAIGDFEAKKDLSYDEKEELEDAMKLISPRIRNEPKKIVNRQGLLRGSRGRMGGRRGFYR